MNINTISRYYLIVLISLVFIMVVLAILAQNSPFLVLLSWVFGVWVAIGFVAIIVKAIGQKK